MKREKYRRLTPLRILELMRKLVRARATSDHSVKDFELSTTADALEEHLKSELTKSRRVSKGKKK